MFSASAQPLITYKDVFTAGTEGYHTFRIPAIVTTVDGTLIAFAEAAGTTATILATVTTTWFLSAAQITGPLGPPCKCSTTQARNGVLPIPRLSSTGPTGEF